MRVSAPTVTAYADCFSGISGDMFLAALLDAGLEIKLLQAELAKLNLKKFSLRASRKLDHALNSTRLEIESDQTAAFRTWVDIRKLLIDSDLPGTIKEKSLLVFACLADAEARIHNCSPDEVHFHEIGGLDTLIDIVGTVIGLDHFGIEQLVSSPIPMPRGWVRCSHGRLPLPAPAVCEILKEVPVYGTGIDQELVTPTGAALIKTLSSDFGDFPAMRISHIGYGAGSRALPGDTPNLFRLLIGKTRKTAEIQEVEIVSTNLDDWSPESYPYLCEQLFSLGALDVSLCSIQMKKGRPGFMLQVMTDPARSLQIKNCLLTETGSIGLRFRREKRMTLPRENGSVNTPWGPVRVKRVETPKGVVLYPEYEDCCRMARSHSVLLKEIYAAVNRCLPDDFIPMQK